MSNDNKIKSDQYRKMDENEDKKKSLITNQRIFCALEDLLRKIYNEFDFYKYLN